MSELIDERAPGDDVLQHIIRTDLPWRAATRTRCGRDAAELAAGRCITLEAARTKVNRLGKQRAAMVLCMTCCNHIGDWPEWDDNPVARMARECAGGMFRSRFSRPEHDEIERDLRAITILIENHRAEFLDLVVKLATGDVVTMASLRRGKAKR